MTDDDLTLDPALAEPPSEMQRHLGFELTGWAEGRSRVELDLKPSLMNRQGLPHGGVHATLLDTAMGFSGCYTGTPGARILALTLSLNINFVAVAKGTRLRAYGTRTGGGRSTFFAEGRLVDDTGLLIATGTGVFRHKPA